MLIFESPMQAVDHAAECHADFTKGFIIGGQSAGATYAAVLTHRAVHDPFFEKCRPTGQVLQIPLLLHPEAVPEEYVDSPAVACQSEPH